MKKLILFKVVALNVVVLFAQNDYRPEIHCNLKSRNWKADPWFDEKETLEPNPDDYKSANAVLKTDRGTPSSACFF